MTTCQIGATGVTLVNTDTVFYGNPGGVVYFNPKVVPVPGGEEYRSMDGFARWRGFQRAIWEVAGQALSSYEMVVAILCSTLGTGTVSRNAISHSQLDGSGTAFTTEIAVGDTIIAHLGSGVYEHMIVTHIANSTTLSVSADIANNLSGVTFRYRPHALYSGSCYVTTPTGTHLGDDVYQTFLAVALCPDPSKLRPRWGGRYPAMQYEFLLKSIYSP